jgi:aminocarboxymuconate-semialdehyde decarboxylase
MAEGSIDVHTHFLPGEWPSFEERYGTPDWPWLRRDSATTATVMVGERVFRVVDERSWDPAARLAAMDHAGVEVQVLSATPVLFGYGREPGEALGAARVFNDLARELAAAAPERLLTFCQVPLQDVDAACRELERCLADGHLGVEIGNHVGDTYLDDSAVVEFLQHCADLGAPVFVHPWDMRPPAAMRDLMLPWTIGMPTETHLSIARLVLTGAFDRLPRSLRICFAHGGGSFAFWLGRLEHAWHRVKAARGTCELPPSQYVDRFMVDSAVFDDRALGLLVDVMGEDQVLLGSDFPFEMGEQDAGALVSASTRLSAQTQRKVLRTNPARFLGLGG